MPSLDFQIQACSVLLYAAPSDNGNQTQQTTAQTAAKTTMFLPLQFLYSCDVFIYSLDSKLRRHALSLLQLLLLAAAVAEQSNNCYYYYS
jgi:hypothetical protein